MRIVFGGVAFLVLFWATECVIERVAVDNIEGSFELLEPWPTASPKPQGCCDNSSTTVYLGAGKIGSGVVDSITYGGVGQVVVAPGSISPLVPCSLRALLKVTFDKLPSCIDGCLRYPLCGKRMLRVDLELSPTNRSYFMFDIGDSVSNDGYGGDYSDQTNDAEIDAVFPNVYVRPSDHCPDPPRLLATYTDAVKLGSVNRITLFISNEHIRITNDQGLNQILCHKCLFALNGQPDPSVGGVNQDIYIALNRVIADRADRYGFGVCSARLSWVCPESY
ncbi:uncharacterized protein LOC127851674 [Dreissena polymorpha]|uniref:Uncharacterized protein n=1 Tax=Dreissena polymorpha TaxID=45954 RepID=A0A9D4HX92_DREPO|nr:uncharacterized protein LOC127851674 [Dreissena polymorpha]KAH3736192.1 hypothetical protein DPMN_042755 [Dreissena polymorpha]